MDTSLWAWVSSGRGRAAGIVHDRQPRGPACWGIGMRVAHGEWPRELPGSPSVAVGMGPGEEGPHPGVFPCSVSCSKRVAAPPLLETGWCSLSCGWGWGRGGEISTQQPAPHTGLPQSQIGYMVRKTITLLLVCCALRGVMADGAFLLWLLPKQHRITPLTRALCSQVLQEI